MANKKITDLNALTGAASDVLDVYPIVDVSATETKKQTRAELFKSIPAADFVDTFVFNDAGADKDARFEGDTDQNLLFTDASTDRVGIGTATPVAKLQVAGSIAFLAPAVVTTDYTVADNVVFVVVNKGSAAVLTLPTPASSAGRVLFVSNIGGAFAVTSASAIVVPRAGGSAGTAILPGTGGDGSWVIMVCDGTNWLIVAGALGTS